MTNSGSLTKKVIGRKLVIVPNLDNETRRDPVLSFVQAPEVFLVKKKQQQEMKMEKEFILKTMPGKEALASRNFWLACIILTSIFGSLAALRELQI